MTYRRVRPGKGRSLRRNLTMRDGIWEKFWRIEVADAIVAIRFGRQDTYGQERAWRYPTPEDALAAGTKRVEAKLTQGYTDDPAPVGPLFMPGEYLYVEDAPAPRTARPSSARQLKVPRPTAPPVPATVFGPDDLGLVVNPFDAAINLGHVPEKLSYTEIFDTEAELSRAMRVVHTIGRDLHGEKLYDWLPEEPVLTTIPTPEQAQWWRRLSYCAASSDLKAYRAMVADREPVRVDRHVRSVSPGIHVAIEAALTSPDEFVATLAAPIAESRSPHGRGEKWDLRALLALPARALLPLCKRETLQLVRDALPTPLPPMHPQRGTYDVHGGIITAAAIGGLEAEVAAALAALPDRCLAPEDGLAYEGTYSLLLPLCAPTAAERVALAARLGVTPADADDVQSWLIATGLDGLPMLTRWIEQASHWRATYWLRQASVILHGPAAVPFFARLATAQNGSAVAQAWLSNHVRAVLDADVPAAYAEPLAAALRTVPLPELTQARTNARATVARVIDELLAMSARPVFGADGYPDWWQPSVPARAKLPTWIDIARLPPLMVDGHRLDGDDLAALLSAAIAGGLDNPPATLAQVREQATAASRDRLAVALLISWLGAGAPSKDKWLLPTCARLGADGYVLRLGRMARDWPRRSAHIRAAEAVESLAEAGTDGALQQISRIATVARHPSLQTRAEAAMQRIAAARQLTREQLDDRIVPDAGLGSDGTRRLDFGPRAFLVGVGSTGTLVIREERPDGRPTGKPRTGLPTPNSRDDATLARLAKDELAVLRKSVAEVASFQASRFEQAMISGRRWRATEHEEFIAAHPLLSPLLSAVVWGVYASDDSLVELVRMVSDALPGEARFADLYDEEFTPAEAQALGIVHPVELSDGQRRAWGRLLADYELSPPFAQLERPAYRLPDDRTAATELAALLPSRRLPATTLMGVFAKHGWVRGSTADDATHCLHLRQFASHQLTAVIRYDDGITVGPLTDQEEQILGHVDIIEGLHRADDLDWGESIGSARHPVVAWSRVPATVTSEVLATFHAIVD